MRKRTILLIIVTLLLFALLAACSESVTPEKASMPYQPMPVVYTPEEPEPLVTMLDMSIGTPRLIGVHSDRAYFFYAFQEEDNYAHCTYGACDPLVIRRHNRIAWMPVDGGTDDVVDIWEGESREGENDGQKYFAEESFLAAAVMPDGNLAALIVTSTHLHDSEQFDDSAFELLPDGYYNIIIFDSDGNITSDYDVLDLMDATYRAVHYVSGAQVLGMYATADGNIVLQTGYGFYLFDPTGDGSITSIFGILWGGYHMWSTSAVTPENEIIAVVQPFNEREKQLWRICIESGEPEIIWNEMEHIASHTLRSGGTHDIYMNVFCCRSDQVGAETRGVIGLDLDTSEAYFLFDWNDVITEHPWGADFTVCDAGYIWFFREYRDTPQSGTILERLDLNDFSYKMPWHCNCVVRRIEHYRATARSAARGGNLNNITDLAQRAARAFGPETHITLGNLVMIDNDAAYFAMSGWLVNEVDVEIPWRMGGSDDGKWIEGIFPLCFETFEFQAPIYHAYGLIAAQTGVSSSGAFWVAEVGSWKRSAPSQSLIFTELDATGAVISRVTISERTALATFNAERFSLNAFQFAIVEEGIFIAEHSQPKTTLGLLSFDGQLERLDIPDGYFPNLP